MDPSWSTKPPPPVKAKLVVYVIANDWKMRTAVRAELREVGVEALGMDSSEDVGRAIASGGLPNLVVLEATAELVGGPRIQDLIQHVPTIVIASRTEKVSLPNAAAVLYRPVSVAGIVSRVRELLLGDAT